MLILQFGWVAWVVLFRNKLFRNCNIVFKKMYRHLEQIQSNSIPNEIILTYTCIVSGRWWWVLTFRNQGKSLKIIASRIFARFFFWVRKSLQTMNSILILHLKFFSNCSLKHYHKQYAPLRSKIVSSVHKTWTSLIIS